MTLTRGSWREKASEGKRPLLVYAETSLIDAEGGVSKTGKQSQSEKRAGQIRKGEQGRTERKGKGIRFAYLVKARTGERRGLKKEKLVPDTGKEEKGKVHKSKR